MAGENETIILISDELKERGYFSFGTSYPNHYKRICKVVGPENFGKVRIDHDSEMKERWWDVEIPIRFLTPSLAIRRPVKLTRKLSEEERAARVARMKEVRARQAGARTGNSE